MDSMVVPMTSGDVYHDTIVDFSFNSRIKASLAVAPLIDVVDQETDVTRHGDDHCGRRPLVPLAGAEVREVPVPRACRPTRQSAGT